MVGSHFAPAPASLPYKQQVCQSLLLSSLFFCTRLVLGRLALPLLLGFGEVLLDISRQDPKKPGLILWKDTSKTPSGCKERVWSLLNPIQDIPSIVPGIEEMPLVSTNGER